MAKKYYAVRKGYYPGIFNNWAECQKSINGFSGAEYRGFNSEDEAEAYMHGKEVGTKGGSSVDIPKPTRDNIVIYTDGSYKNEKLAFGVVISTLTGDFNFYGCIEDRRFASINNIAGELVATLIGVELAIDLGFYNMTIIYDYRGVYEFLNTWNAYGELQRYYQSLMNNLRVQNGLKYDFIKVAGHSGVQGNKMADSLAARGANFNHVVDINKILKGTLTVSDVPRL